VSASPRPSTPSRAASPANARVSLADLRASGGAFQWYEAAAVVQGLCRAINESPDPVTKTELTLHKVFLDPEGTISLEARPDPAGALPQVRTLLFEMLPRTEVARAQVLPESSLQDFSRALEGYERADRAEVIKEVRGRWRPSAMWAFDPIGKPETTPEAAAGAKDTARRRRRPRLVAGAVLVVAVVGGAGWVLSTPHLEAKIRTYAAAISSERPPTVAATVPAVTSGPPTAPGAKHPATVPARPPRSEGTAQPRSDGPVAGATARVVLSRDLGASGVTRSAPASSTPPGLSPAPTTPHAEPADAAVRPEVFDATQRDVVPPAFLDSGSIRPRATEARQPEAAALEVMVNERGTIDAVKAARSPRTLAESMQMMNDLSAAKTWRFRPAMRDGHPVKYRLVVRFGSS
jgi:hypothetical protein